LSTHAPQASKRVLDPVERTSEVLFGLIMVLTFTGSLSAGDVARDDIRAMLIGAIGCNLAWGLVDAVMYVMSSLTQRGRALSIIRAIRTARDPQTARGLIADVLPPTLVEILRPDEIDSFRERVKNLPEPPARVTLQRDDWLGAIGVFLLVFLSTFPVVIPFIFMTDARLALRVSNGIAIVMLFLTGYAMARYAGARAVRVGVAMVVIGLVLVGLTIALGG
jgi:hypothetical protein